MLLTIVIASKIIILSLANALKTKLVLTGTISKQQYKNY